MQIILNDINKQKLIYIKPILKKAPNSLIKQEVLISKAAAFDRKGPNVLSPLGLNIKHTNFYLNACTNIFVITIQPANCRPINVSIWLTVLTYICIPLSE